MGSFFNPKNNPIADYTLGSYPLRQQANGQYAFISKLLLEYLIAQSSASRPAIDTKVVETVTPKDENNLLNREQNLGSLLEKTFNKALFVDEQDQLRLLADSITRGIGNSETIKNELFQLVYASRSKPVEIAAANAITILNYARISFSGMNLSRINISNADLSNAICCETEFINANLLGVNFVNAYLGYANFKNANMREVQFGKPPNIKQKHEITRIAISLDKTVLAVADIKGYLKVYELENLTGIIALQDYTYWRRANSIVSLCINSDGNYVATLSLDSKIRVWNIKEARVIQRYPYEGNVSIYRDDKTFCLNPSGKLLALYQIDPLNSLDDTFAAHRHIAEFFHHPNLEREQVTNWWSTTGKETYYDNIRQLAAHGLDKSRWGSEVEINVVAWALNLNILWKKDEKTQQLGVGGGLIALDQLQEIDIAELVDQGIGRKYLNNFRIFSFSSIDALKNALDKINESTSSIILQLLDRNESDLIFPSEISGIENCEELAQQLAARNILMRKGDKKYYFVAKADGEVDKETIICRLQSIRPELSALVLEHFVPNTTLVHLLYTMNHWIYMRDSNIAVRFTCQIRMSRWAKSSDEKTIVPKSKVLFAHASEQDKKSNIVAIKSSSAQQVDEVYNHQVEEKLPTLVSDEEYTRQRWQGVRAEVTVFCKYNGLFINMVNGKNLLLALSVGNEIDTWQKSAMLESILEELKSYLGQGLSLLIKRMQISHSLVSNQCQLRITAKSKQDASFIQSLLEEAGLRFSQVEEAIAQEKEPRPGSIARFQPRVISLKHSCFQTLWQSNVRQLPNDHKGQKVPWELSEEYKSY